MKYNESVTLVNAFCMYYCNILKRQNRKAKGDTKNTSLKRGTHRNGNYKKCT